MKIKNTYIMIRLSENEKADAKLKAERRGMDLSKYLRTRIREDKIKPKKEKAIDWKWDDCF